MFVLGMILGIIIGGLVDRVYLQVTGQLKDGAK